MHQTKLVSLVEVLLNIATGFVVSVLIMFYVVPWTYPHITVSGAQSFGITTIFTVTSVIRSYLWRRFFNAGLHRIVARAFGSNPPAEMRDTRAGLKYEEMGPD